MKSNLPLVNDLERVKGMPLVILLWKLHFFRISYQIFDRKCCCVTNLFDLFYVATVYASFGDDMTLLCIYVSVRTEDYVF